MAKETRTNVKHNCVESRNTINMTTQTTTCHTCGKQTTNYGEIERLLELQNERN